MKRLIVAMLMMGATLSAGIISGCDFSGSYVGLGIGSMVNDVGVDHRVELILDVQADSNTQASGRFCHKKVSGDFFLGWGKTFCRSLYLGGRLGVNLSERSFSFRYSSRVNSNDAIISVTSIPTARFNLAEPTLDLRAGLVACRNMMLYGLLGVTYNRIELQSQTPLTFEGEGITLPSSRHSDLAGFRVGGGLEYLLCGHYGVGLSYVYTSYPSTTLNFNFQGLVTTRYRASPSRQNFGLHLAYYF